MRDVRIKRKVEKILRKYRAKANVTVEDGIVFIKGTVTSWREYVEIGKETGKIKGVEGVVNDLEYPGKEKKRKKRGKERVIGKADVVIIGGGVVGCAIARELSKYKLNIILVEKSDDVGGGGATKANNALVHTGIGEKMGTLKQKLCVEGHKMFRKIAEELDVPYEECGMWIVISEDSIAYRLPRILKKFLASYIIPFIILRRAKKLGIEMYKVSKKELLKREPYVTEKAIAAVFSPSYAMTCPFRYTIALAENAMENGVKIMLNTEVVDITVENGNVGKVITTKGAIETKFVINAAGLYADEIASLAGAREYTIHPKKGATLIFDKETRKFLNHSMTLLRLPRIEHYKGGGIMLTVDGNVQWGPTIDEIEDKEDTSVTAEEIERIFKTYEPLMPKFPKKAVIAYFSGIRAASFTEDFIIRAAKKVKGFIHVAGIQSPGLAASPAIAKMVASILQQEGLKMELKKDFNPIRKAPPIPREMDMAERKKLVERDGRYGRIVCRCEEVTEGEIVDAIHSKIPARSIDAIKRRTRAGMGRCQGSFCLPHVAKILARELNIPLEEVKKGGDGSELFIGKAKCLLEGKNES